MTGAPTRRYRSPVRARQAEANRQRMLDAARELMLQRGYTETTIDDIAAAAEVAPQTVRAVFGTKAKLLVAVLERAAYGTRYQDLVRQAEDAPSAAAHIAQAAAITCHIHQSLAAEMDLLRGISTLDAELRGFEQRLAQRRRSGQTPVIRHLVTSGNLRPGLDAAAAADIVWTLTSPEVFRLLVSECGWSPQHYQQWLTGQLTTSLLTQTAPDRGRPSGASA